MAKIPTDVERSVTARAPLPRAYAYLWDVVGSSACIPGLDSCRPVGDDTYVFTYAARPVGPVSIVARYTARYAGNGTDRITFEGIGAKEDNTDVSGVITLHPTGAETTRIVLHQRLAPDTPVPRLLHGLVHSFVEKEAAHGVRQFLDNVKRALEKPPSA